MRYRLIGSFLAVLIGMSAGPAAHAQKMVLLIRHAEQALDVEDPPLTDAGRLRAKAWAGILRDAGIKVVYTSKKRRTKQTGTPISQALAVPLETMPRRDVAGLVDRLRTRHGNEVVLIVGHSRSVPKLIKKMGHTGDVTIKRDDYGSLFVVVPRGKNAPTVMRLRYPRTFGGPS